VSVRNTALREGEVSRLAESENRVSSRTEPRAFSFPPHSGGRRTQRGICFSRKQLDVGSAGRAELQPRRRSSQEEGALAPEGTFRDRG
jgi:hypothetical protein